MKQDRDFLKRRNWIVEKILFPILYVLALWGSAIAFLIRQEGSAFAHQARVGAGYSPASNQTSKDLRKPSNSSKAM